MQPDRKSVRDEVYGLLALVSQSQSVRSLIEGFDLLVPVPLFPAIVFHLASDEPVSTTHFLLTFNIRIAPDLGAGGSYRGPHPEDIVEAVIATISNHTWLTTGITLYEEPSRDSGLTQRFVFARGPFVTFKLKYTP